MPYTLHIHIKPLLAEYLYGRYSDFIEEGALHLPAGCYLYITLQELLGRRPASAPLRETATSASASPLRTGGKILLTITILLKMPSASSNSVR